MKQLVYLDTSVISGLEQKDDKTRMHETHLFWDLAKLGRFDLVISDLTIAEITRAPAMKAAVLRSRLLEIDMRVVYIDDESRRLGGLYIAEGGLPPKSRNDAMHLAVASVHRCDIVLSWNFRHIVNTRASSVVDVVNIREGYRTLKILPPPMMAGSEEVRYGSQQI